MLTQFFGKPFWITLSGLLGIFCLSIPIYLFIEPSQSQWFLWGIVAIVFALTLWRLELGVFIAFAELIAFSHGHLISSSFAPFSLRIAIFFSVIFAWLVLLFSKKVRPQFNHPFVAPLIFILVALFIGFARAFSIAHLSATDGALINHRILVNALMDGNAYCYLLYAFPLLSVTWTSEKKRQLLQVFFAASIWVGLLTLGIVFVFSHFPEWMLGTVYKFFRDTRLAEITKMYEGIFRVFLPSQIYPLFAALVLGVFYWMRNLSKKEWIILSFIKGLCLATVIISLSRSYWLGGFVGVICFLALNIIILKPGYKRVLHAFGSDIYTFFIAFFLIIFTLFLPISYQQVGADGLSSVFASRTTDLGDVAISSRWKLLDPMLETIASAPLLGSGFGTTVSFETDDPRAVAMTGGGIWTTYAMEWGWLELWLKMGLLGPIAFLFLFYRSIKGLWPYLSTKATWLGIGFISSLVILFCTHFFSPYLNHPLGLGLFLFLIPFIETRTSLKQEVIVKEEGLNKAKGMIEPALS